MNMCVLMNFSEHWPPNTVCLKSFSPQRIKEHRNNPKTTKRRQGNVGSLLQSGSSADLTSCIGLSFPTWSSVRRVAMGTPEPSCIGVVSYNRYNPHVGDVTSSSFMVLRYKGWLLLLMFQESCTS